MRSAQQHAWRHLFVPVSSPQIIMHVLAVVSMNDNVLCPHLCCNVPLHPPPPPLRSPAAVTQSAAPHFHVLPPHPATAIADIVLFTSAGLSCSRARGVPRSRSVSSECVLQPCVIESCAVGACLRFQCAGTGPAEPPSSRIGTARMEIDALLCLGRPARRCCRPAVPHMQAAASTLPRRTCCGQSLAASSRRCAPARARAAPAPAAAAAGMASGGSVFAYTQLQLETQPGIALFDITPQIREHLASTGVQEGVVNVISRHTTTAVTINEAEARLMDDVRQVGGCFFWERGGDDWQCSICQQRQRSTVTALPWLRGWSNARVHAGTCPSCPRQGARAAAASGGHATAPTTPGSDQGEGGCGCLPAAVPAEAGAAHGALPAQRPAPAGSASGLVSRLLACWLAAAGTPNKLLVLALASPPTTSAGCTGEMCWRDGGPRLGPLCPQARRLGGLGCPGAGECALPPAQHAAG